jgi:hypothetical protein
MTKVINHISHGLGDHVTGHTHPGNIARDGAPKKVHEIAVHDGMRTKSKSGADALSGHHASALDSMSGATVPAARNMSAPGWGQGSVRTGNPLAHPPGSKNTRRAPVHPSMSKGADHDNALHELGQAVLRQAAARFVENKPAPAHAAGIETATAGKTLKN